MEKNLKLINVTTQDFGASKDMELHDVRWEKIKPHYFPLLQKAGLKKITTIRVWNKANKFRYLHVFEYSSQKSFEDCQPIWKQIEPELFKDLLVKMVSDKGVVVAEDV